MSSWVWEFAPDGSRAVTIRINHAKLELWDIEPGRPVRLLEGHSDFAGSVALTADAANAVSGSADGALIVWDLAADWEAGRPKRHSSHVRSVSLTPDGKRAVSVSLDKTLIAWDLERMCIERRLEGHTSGVNAVAVTADGCFAASGSEDKTVKFWDLSTGRVERTLAEHSDRVHSVAVTANPVRALSSSFSQLRLWDPITGVVKLYTCLGHNVSVGISADGARGVVAASEDGVAVVDFETGFKTYLKGHHRQTIAVAITPDGSRAASGSMDGEMIVWDLNAMRIVRRLGPRPDEVPGFGALLRDEIYTVALSPDGRLALSGSTRKALCVWNCDTGACLTVVTLDASVRAVAISAGPPYRIAAGDTLGNVHFFDLKVWG